MSEADVGGIAVEVKPFHQQPKFLALFQMTAEQQAGKIASGVKAGALLNSSIQKKKKLHPLIFINNCWVFMEYQTVDVNIVMWWAMHLFMHLKQSGVSNMVEKPAVDTHMQNFLENDDIIASVKLMMSPIAGVKLMMSPIAGVKLMMSPIAGVKLMMSPIAGVKSMMSPIAGVKSMMSPIAGLKKSIASASANNYYDHNIRFLFIAGKNAQKKSL